MRRALPLLTLLLLLPGCRWDIVGRHLVPGQVFGFASGPVAPGTERATRAEAPILDSAPGRVSLRQSHAGGDVFLTLSFTRGIDTFVEAPSESDVTFFALVEPTGVDPIRQPPPERFEVHVDDLGTVEPSADQRIERFRITVRADWPARQESLTGWLDYERLLERQVPEEEDTWDAPVDGPVDEPDRYADDYWDC